MSHPDAARIQVFNASRGKCALCWAPLAFVEYGNLEAPTGWIVRRHGDSGQANCARCAREQQRAAEPRR